MHILDNTLYFPVSDILTTSTLSWMNDKLELGIYLKILNARIIAKKTFQLLKQSHLAIIHVDAKIQVCHKTVHSSKSDKLNLKRYQKDSQCAQTYRFLVMLPKTKRKFKKDVSYHNLDIG